MSQEPSNNPAALEPSAEDQFLEKNFKKILLACVLVVVLLGAYGLIQHNRNLAAEAEAEAFTSAKTIDDCDLVIRKHPGTVAAANALLVKADLQWEKNEKSSSVATLKEFTTQFPKHPFHAQTLLAIASKQEAMGDKSDARAGYEQIIASHPNTELAQLAQIRLGDLHWAEGKEDEAKKAYEEATAKFPGLTAFEKEAQTRLEWIAAALPTKEVDPPPAPKPDPKATPPAAGLPAIPGMPGISLKPAESGIGATINPAEALKTPAPAMRQPDQNTPPPPPAPPATPAAPAAPKSATSPAVEVPAPPKPPATPPAAPAATPQPPAPPAAAPAPATPPPAPAPDK